LSVTEGVNQLIKPHIPDLYASAYHWTQNQHEAEDLVQDLIIKSMDNLDTLEKLDKPALWLKKVLYRMFVDRHRRSQFSTVMPSDEISDLVEEDQLSTDESVDLHHERQLRQGLIKAMKSLDAPQRVALSLFEIEGYSLQEIADIQKVSLGTVKSRLHRAKEKLKSNIHLQPFEDSIRVKDRGL